MMSHGSRGRATIRADGRRVNEVEFSLATAQPSTLAMSNPASSGEKSAVAVKYQSRFLSSFEMTVVLLHHPKVMKKGATHRQHFATVFQVDVCGLVVAAQDLFDRAKVDHY